MTIPVLFARSDSVYKTLDCDVYDIHRDALTWLGGSPFVAHPPCRAWGRLRHFANPRAGEKELALWTVEQLRKFGGVLEHPNASTLWPAAGLPPPGHHDSFGGSTLAIDQNWFGHRAQKSTLLYIVGCAPKDIPQVPLSLAYPSHVVGSTDRSRLCITKAEREHTPLDLAIWLCDLATRCTSPAASTSAL